MIYITKTRKDYFSKRNSLFCIKGAEKCYLTYYQSCIAIDILQEKSQQLNKASDNHHINGEISSLLITIQQQFKNIGGMNYEDFD